MSWDGPRQHRRVISPFHELMKISRLDPTIGFFWCLVTLHVVLWTILATVTQPNLPAETLEMLASGREFAWGYATQPPLGVWLAAIVSSLAAPANWPVYLLAQLCGAVSVWAAWKLARKFLHPWTALCAAFVLLGGYSCTIAASAFSGAHLAGALWSLSIYMFHCALTHERRRYWAATGLCLALGFLSSYGTLLLLLTMFIFTLVDDRARRCWDSSWPFLAGMAMIACLMPHFLWLANHQFLTVQAGIEHSASVAHHLVQPLSFLGTQLLCVIPVIVLLTPLVAWFSFEEPAKSEEADGEDRDFARHYLLWMTCLPPAVIFGLSLVAGPSSGLFAGVTNWSYLGVVVLMWGHLSETRIAWRRSIVRIGTAVGMFAAALISLNLMVPQIRHTGASTQFPGAALAREIETLWANAGYSGKTPVVAGPSHLVRNAAWYANRSFSQKNYADLDPGKNPAVNDQTLIREGGVIVWDMNDQNAPQSRELSDRFGSVTFSQPVNLKWQTDADLPKVRLGMAIVHPASVARSTITSTQQVSHETPAYVTSDGTVIQASSQHPVSANPTQPKPKVENWPAGYPSASATFVAPSTKTVLGPSARFNSIPEGVSTIPVATPKTPVQTEMTPQPTPRQPVQAPAQFERSTEISRETPFLPAVPPVENKAAERAGWSEQ